MPYAMVYPMFAMVVLTVVVGLITFVTRINSVRKDGLDPRYFKTYNVGSPSEQVIKTGRHFSNLFEVPVLFYAGCISAMIVGIGSGPAMIWAWAFFAARVAHAYIHIGSNKLWYRMGAFMISMVCVLGLWTTVVLKVCAAGS